MLIQTTRIAKIILSFSHFQGTRLGSDLTLRLLPVCVAVDDVLFLDPADDQCTGERRRGE